MTKRRRGRPAAQLTRTPAPSVRSGHADVPSTAALLGGVAAQEAIKLITRQYIPLDNTAVYDGVQQAVGTFCL